MGQQDSTVSAADVADTAALAAGLAELRRIVDDGRLADGRGLLGVEIELQLIDQHGAPAPRNAEVLAALAGGDYDLQPELARFNLELNLPPVPLRGAPFTAIRDHIDGVRRAIARVDPPTSALSIGILPSLTAAHLTRDMISDRPRYHALDERMMARRGGRLAFRLAGATAPVESLHLDATTILPEAAATSLQIHLDLPADGFPAAWNAAQAIAAVQIAMGANAPLLCGRALWHETRIPLFEQVIDDRTPAEVLAGAPPRVWFGARWIDHPADLFAENVAHFGQLLAHPPGAADARTRDDPTLAALTLHNGTVWRWNRPVFALIDGRPTVRLENRVLAAPPSAVDATADIALFLGLVAGLRDRADLIAALPFEVAGQNFRRAARDGIGATVDWPSHGRLREVPVTMLVRDELLAVAADGLDALGVPRSEAEPALAIIAGRAATGRNGATWQAAALTAERAAGAGDDAPRRVVQRYRVLQDDGAPAHTWPLPAPPCGPS